MWSKEEKKQKREKKMYIQPQQRTYYLLLMFRLLARRNYSINWRFKDVCPSPRYDTGCTYCQPEFPTNLAIDFDKNLNKTGAIPTKHVMVLTNPINQISELPSKTEFIPNSIPSEITKYRTMFQTDDQRVTISVIHLNNNRHQQILDQYNIKPGSSQQLVFLYPSMKIIIFDLSVLDQFVKKYLYSKPTAPVYNPFVQAKPPASNNDLFDSIVVDESNFIEDELDKDLLVICGHAKRDLRCGIIAPQLESEFNQVLVRHNLQDTIYTGQVSHVGGHAYAGNVLYYPKDCQTSKDFIWYGRVFPKDVQGIVELTIINKEIIKDLFRGDIEAY